MVKDGIPIMVYNDCAKRSFDFMERFKNKYNMENDSLKYLDKRGKKAFAHTMINHRENHLHHINDIIICKYLSFFISVNKTTLVFNKHDTEELALNHVLDFYKCTKGEQIDLFLKNENKIETQKED